MKQFALLALYLTSLTSQAANLVLPNYSEGLQRGIHKIVCNYKTQYGGQGNYQSDGPNNSPNPEYSLPSVIKELNSIINDKSTTTVNLSVTLICNNQTLVNYYFNTEDLKANKELSLNPPAGC